VPSRRRPNLLPYRGWHVQRAVWAGYIILAVQELPCKLQSEGQLQYIILAVQESCKLQAASFWVFGF
jgi:hypothetical protein